MARLRVHNIGVSLDGFMAGPDQGPDHPLGVGGERLHGWAFATRSFRALHGLDGGTGGVDDDYVAQGDDGIGATIIGRNMFGPVRGPWTAPDWNGWWGDDPPFHHPVFVLTRHAREPVEMAGGTTFHFVTEGPQVALERARAAADGRDVRVGGGAATLQQYLCRGAIDELHLALVPVLLGRGERLFESLDRLADDYEVTEMCASEAVTHLRLTRVGPTDAR